MSREFEFKDTRSYKKNPIRRFVGTELEISHTNNRTNLIEDIKKIGVMVGNDGSIKDGNIDLELRTHPTRGDRFISTIDKVGKIFEKYEVRANDSCGFHVHVDVRDFKDPDLDNLLLLWSKVEPTLGRIIDKSRLGNNFCRPWNFSPSLEETKKTLAYPINGYRERYVNCTWERYQQVMGDLSKEVFLKRKKMFEENQLLSIFRELHYTGQDRYRSLNLTAITKYGTVENRMHEGTSDPEEIKNWTVLTAAIVDFAKEFPRSKIDELSNGPETILRLAPPPVVGWYLTKLPKEVAAKLKPVTMEEKPAKKVVRSRKTAPAHAEAAHHVDPALDDYGLVDGGIY